MLLIQTTKTIKIAENSKDIAVIIKLNLLK